MALGSNTPWEFADKSKLVITSHERLRNLGGGGFYFEACAVQATVVEALLFFSILNAAAEKLAEESKTIRQRLSCLTLGGLICRARKHSLLDVAILNQIDQFKNKRNYFVHHHLVELHDFDYENALKEGDDLISRLFQLVRKKAHLRLSALGHKGAENFLD